MTWIEVDPSETCSSLGKVDDDAFNWAEEVDALVPGSGGDGRRADPELEEGGGA